MTLSLANRARLETVDRALSAELLGVAGGRPVAHGYVVCSRDSTRILGKVGMPYSPAPVMWVRQSRQYQDLE